MNTNTQKQFAIQNYILIFSDILALCLSYALAFITRGILSDFHKNPQYYHLVLSFAILLCIFS